MKKIILLFVVLSILYGCEQPDSLKTGIIEMYSSNGVVSTVNLQTQTLKDACKAEVYVKRIEISKDGRNWTTVLQSTETSGSTALLYIENNRNKVGNPIIIECGQYEAVKVTIDYKVRILKDSEKNDVDILIEGSPSNWPLFGHVDLETGEILFSVENGELSSFTVEEEITTYLLIDLRVSYEDGNDSWTLTMHPRATRIL